MYEIILTSAFPFFFLLCQQYTKCIQMLWYIILYCTVLIRYTDSLYVSAKEKVSFIVGFRFRKFKLFLLMEWKRKTERKKNMYEKKIQFSPAICCSFLLFFTGYPFWFLIPLPISTISATADISIPTLKDNLFDSKLFFFKILISFRTFIATQVC